MVELWYYSFIKINEENKMLLSEKLIIVKEF